MWFDEIMDDCKKGLEIASKNKGVFIPILVNAGINILFFICLFVITVIFFIRHGRDLENVFNNTNNFLVIILPIIIGGIAIYLFFTIVGVMIEVGSVNLYKIAAEGIKPRASYFFNGIKRYFFRVFVGTLLFHIILFVLSIPILVLLILYTFTVGILTAGWGLIFIGVLAGVYFNAWTIAVVVDDMGPLEAIGTSVKLGKKYFWGLFVLTLAALMISQYLVAAFGPLVSMIGGWFISGVILAYFKLVTLLVYKRKRHEVRI
ncbi:hypothetical protein [Petroclostridium xylanilyticum]|uniref:hypothetical protein n=1 Tax=Petroclostridium xylanilyticum TaxID=1792311 RepID=UPI000B98891E|nr:hypothetical protein [Petroclostridium xylanilyticum]